MDQTGQVTEALTYELIEARKRIAELEKLDASRLMAEKAVENLLETLGAIVRGIPSGLFIYEHEPPDKLVLLNGNPEALRMTGLKLEDHRGKETGYLWFDDAGNPLAPHLLLVANTGESYENFSTVFRNGGSDKVFKLKAFQLPESKIGIAFEDKSSSKGVEDQLFEVTASTAKNIELLRKLDVLKEELVHRQGTQQELQASHDMLEHRLHDVEARFSEINEALKKEASNRSLAETALRETVEKYRTLIGHCPVGLIICDISGDITEFGDVLLDHPGLQTRDTGTNVLTFKPFVDSGISKAMSSCLKSGDAFKGDFRLENPNGGVSHLRVRAVPLRNGGGSFGGLLTAFEDISDQKRAEELLLGCRRLKAVGEMAGGVAYRLNNWLQVASGGAQTALGCLDSDNFTEIGPLLQEISNSTRQASETVGQLQQFAAEDPASDAEKRIFDLSKASQKAVEICMLCCKPSPDENECRITVQTDFAGDCFINGYEHEITELILNLLKNAYEANSESGTINIRTFHQGEKVYLEVEDHGPGITDEDLESVFQPFWTSKPTNFGLGLTVSEEIVVKHGGSIAVRKAGDKGSVFVVELPCAAEPSCSAGSADKTSTNVRMKILLIDDSRPVVTILEKALTRMGQKVYTALSGRQGLDLFEENEIDVIVCDLAMEGMNGWDVSRSIQAVCVEKSISKPPFILLTGWAGQLSRTETGRHPDVDRIVEKPITIPKLMEIMLQEVEKGSGIS